MQTLAQKPERKDSFNSLAQTTEWGISLGGSLFSGDVNPDFAWRETKPSLAFLGRYYLSNKFTLRSSLLFSSLSGNDYKDMSFSAQEIHYKIRNLSFRSRIVELSIGSEYYFKNLFKKKSSPYLFAAVGCFYFNPKARYQGKWYELQPLGTEGQGLVGSPKEKYNRLQALGMIGAGYKLGLSRRIHLSFEIGLRFTSTDYLDDVSTKYADKGALRANGDMSPILADRSAERDYNFASHLYIAQNSTFTKSYDSYGYASLKGYGQAGDQRGNPKNKDKYLIYSFTLSCRLYKMGLPTQFLLD